MVYQVIVSSIRTEILSCFITSLKPSLSSCAQPTYVLDDDPIDEHSYIPSRTEIALLRLEASLEPCSVPNECFS